MSYRPGDIDRETAEQLLHGAPGVLHGAGPLAAPIHAARYPAFPDELVGESAALAAFRAAAHLHPAPSRRRKRVVPARMFTVKAVAVLTAAGVGGVALASSAGVLPTPLTPERPPAVPATRVSAPPSAASDQSTIASPAPVTPSAADDVPSPARSSTMPSQSLTGRCRALSAQPDPSRAVATPAFADLVTAAGGPDQVVEYCADLGEFLTVPSAGVAGEPSRPPVSRR